MRILIFGDSITYGAWDTELGGWANRLRIAFDKENQDWNIYNLGVSGDTINDVLKRFDVECQAREPEKLIFAIGINDAKVIIDKNSNQTSEADFKKTFQS